MKSIKIAAFATCLVIASSTTATPQDTPKDTNASSQRKQVMPKELLKSLVGSWEGTCQTWFEPGKLADESESKVRFARYSMAGSFATRMRARFRGNHDMGRR